MLEKYSLTLNLFMYVLKIRKKKKKKKKKRKKKVGMILEKVIINYSFYPFLITIVIIINSNL